MTTIDGLIVVGVVAFLIPPLVYISVKLASYGWLKGRELYYREFDSESKREDGEK